MASPDSQVQLLVVMLARRQRRLNLILGLLLAFDVTLFATCGLAIYVQQQAGSDTDAATAKTASLSRSGTEAEKPEKTKGEEAAGGGESKPKEHVEEVMIPVPGYLMIAEEAFSDRATSKAK